MFIVTLIIYILGLLCGGLAAFFAFFAEDTGKTRLALACFFLFGCAFLLNTASWIQAGGQ